MTAFAVHLVCAHAGAEERGHQPLALVGPAVWSETYSSLSASVNTVSTNVATGVDAKKGAQVFQVRTTVDIFFAIGGTPDATASPRRFLASGEAIDVLVGVGDKFAVVSA